MAVKEEGVTTQHEAGMALILYGTSECHLCERAQALVRESTGRAAEEVDVADDDDLFQRYGLRIPVLQLPDSGAELDWPFDAAAVRGLLDAGRVA